MLLKLTLKILQTVPPTLRALQHGRAIWRLKSHCGKRGSKRGSLPVFGGSVNGGRVHRGTALAELDGPLLHAALAQWPVPGQRGRQLRVVRAGLGALPEELPKFFRVRIACGRRGPSGDAGGVLSWGFREDGGVVVVRKDRARGQDKRETVFRRGNCIGARGQRRAPLHRGERRGACHAGEQEDGGREELHVGVEL